jgi:hypothetical protein
MVLLDGRGFERVLSDVLGSLQIVSVRYAPKEKGEPEERAVIIFRTDSDAVDQFHNLSSGYRAQFYVASELGECANRVAAEAFSRRLLLNAGSNYRPSETITCALPDFAVTTRVQNMDSPRHLVSQKTSCGPCVTRLSLADQSDRFMQT